MSAPLELVLLTSEFPYGNVSEPFLETELEVLARRFDRIYVLPSHRRSGTRRLPSNAELVRMDWLNEPSGMAKRAALSSREAMHVMLSTLTARPNVSPYVRAPRIYADILARNVLKLRSLARFVEDRRLHRAVFYDYWFENTTLALALLRRRRTVATAICRAHRFDVYDECWQGGLVPFREAKARALDGVFAVSDCGRRYLERRLPGLEGKLHVAYLGVHDPGRPGPVASGSRPVVVTCARLIPSKRVHLVPQVLAHLAQAVHWIHLGDGPDRDRVLAAAVALEPSTTWEFRGQVDNQEVRRFYSEQRVDAFLSLSTSEGLPVSMMEAQSYGIPIVAPAVGGIPEIVNDRTGVLLPAHASPADAAAGLGRAFTPGRFDPWKVRSHFCERFDASLNYNRFADELIALHEG